MSVALELSVNILDTARLEELSELDAYLTTLDYQLICDEFDEACAALEVSQLKLMEYESVFGCVPN